MIDEWELAEQEEHYEMILDEITRERDSLREAIAGFMDRLRDGWMPSDNSDDGSCFWYHPQAADEPMSPEHADLYKAERPGQTTPPTREEAEAILARPSGPKFQVPEQELARKAP